MISVAHTFRRYREGRGSCTCRCCTPVHRDRALRGIGAIDRRARIGAGGMLAASRCVAGSRRFAASCGPAVRAADAPDRDEEFPRGPATGSTAILAGHSASFVYGRPAKIGLSAMLCSLTLCKARARPAREWNQMSFALSSSLRWPGRPPVTATRKPPPRTAPQVLAAAGLGHLYRHRRPQHGTQITSSVAASSRHSGRRISAAVAMRYYRCCRWMFDRRPGHVGASRSTNIR